MSGKFGRSSLNLIARNPVDVDGGQKKCRSINSHYTQIFFLYLPTKQAEKLVEE